VARFLTVALLLTGALACAPDADEEAAGHARMVSDLEAVAERVVETNRFLGTAELRQIENELAALPEEGQSARRHELLLRAAVHRLRLGDADGAVADLELADELVERLPAGERDRARIATDFSLAMAWLRYGENRNCVECKSSESCLLPIERGGVHTLPEGSEQAVARLTAVLEHPDVGRSVAIKARWLLNIAYMTLGRWPDDVPADLRIDAARLASGQEFPRFREVAAAVGLDTFDLSGGVVLDDLDGDGRLDVLTSTWDYLGNMTFAHNTGQGFFEDRTEAAGLLGMTGGLNLVHADVDDDGDADVLVLRGAWFGEDGRHPNSLLRNDGGRFVDITYASGLGDVHYPTQTAAWADYDGDGDLDLFVGNEADPGHHYPSQLFRNEGDGTWVDVAASAGVENLGYAKGSSWGDYDDDGDPDLYVSNLAGDNRLYRNEGDGTFVDVAGQLGVTEPQMSFATWFWDYDNDGHLDIYVASYVEDAAEMAAEILGLEHSSDHGRLYRNDGAGGFVDVTEELGLDRLITTMGANFGDLDNDGWLDMYLGTGYPSYEALVPNVMLRNDAGQRFVDVTTAGGFGHLQKGHGIAFGDLDDDGDQDVFEQMGGAYRGDGFHDVLYENPGNDNHFLRLKLVGTTSNRSALGARVRVDVEAPDGPRSIHRHVSSGGSFGSSPLEVHVGLGATEAEEVTVTVDWPTSGTRQTFVLALDGRWELTEGVGSARRLPLTPHPFRHL
jgi:hypothetical protein